MAPGRDPVRDTAPPPSSPSSPPSPQVRGARDLALVVGIAALGALGTALLPGGSPPRLALAFVAVFVLPGYALLEAALPRPCLGSVADRQATAWRLLAALGLSPALTGLAALATALVPGGFRPTPIVLAVTGLAVGLACVAWVRRSRVAETPQRVPHPALLARPREGDPSNSAPER